MRATRLATCLSIVLLLTGIARATRCDTLLANAAEKRDWAAVRALLDQGADINLAQVDGMTALHWATFHDELDIAKSLVARGANVRAPNRYEVTPLAMA